MCLPSTTGGNGVERVYRMNHSQLVSVILPVYNGARYLSEAIESALAQTYRPIEVIVIDDGSTDHSAEVAQGYTPRVRSASQMHSGVAAALNHGIALAQGSWLAFLDADDLWTTTKLTLQMNAINRDTKLDLVFGHVEQFTSPELDDATKRKLYCPPQAFAGYCKGTMLASREALERIGPFDLRWQVGDFIDWYAKALEQGLRHRLLPDILMRRRLHDTNLGIRARNSQSDFVHILKASLDRRRKLSGSKDP